MQESYDIAKIWNQALTADPDLNAFCQNAFHKNLSIFLGAVMEDLPGEQVAPYLALISVEDKGGFETVQAESTVLIFMGIMDKSVTKIGNNTVIRGPETMNQLEKIVRSALEQTDFPPSRWHATSAQPGPHYFERHCFYIVEQDRTIGAD
ncbi:hypothetical protein [Humidesulfovibrio idahonensis]